MEIISINVQTKKKGTLENNKKRKSLSLKTLL